MEKLWTSPVQEDDIRYMPKLVTDPYNSESKAWVAEFQAQGVWIGPCSSEAEAIEVCNFLNKKALLCLTLSDEEIPG